MPAEFRRFDKKTTATPRVLSPKTMRLSARYPDLNILESNRQRICAAPPGRVLVLTAR